MVRIFTYLAFLLTVTISLKAQTLTHGPVIGGVTPDGCRVFVRSSIADTATVEVSTDAAFSAIVQSVSVVTDPAKDNTAIAVCSGLASSTNYFIRVLINSAVVSNVVSFSTLLLPQNTGNQVFIAGSCIDDLSDNDASIFDRAASYNPAMFIQMGDWGYPDASGWNNIYFTSPPTSWANNYGNVQSLYRQRYASPQYQDLLKNVPVDHVYDDRDYMNFGAARDAVSGIIINPFQNKPLGSPEKWFMPAQARTNSIQGYQDLFPGYALPNAGEGIYHSFRSGDVEFFVLDTRSARHAQADAIVNTGGQWKYQPPSGYTLLGAVQMNWLKTGLQNSDATWKIVVSSVPFNMGCRLAYDTLLKIGGGNVPYWPVQAQGLTIPGRGFTAVQYFADSWAGFRNDADTLLEFVLQNDIRNVFVVSGNSNTAGLDDGTNSGLPELNSGNLKRANSQDWLTYQKFMGFNIWNKGGSGLCRQTNFNNTFAKIQVYQGDSLRLSAVDAQGQEVCGYTFAVNQPYKYNRFYQPNRLPVAVADVATVIENSNVTIAVLNNDSDADNDPLMAEIVSSPGNGTASVNNNAIVYTPAPGFTGKDTITYQACDATNATCLNCAEAKVIITVLADTTVGMAELGAHPLLTVYPNPASNTMFVAVDGQHDDLQVQVLNMLGEVVWKQAWSPSAINIHNLHNGVYVVRVSGPENRIIGQQRVMIVGSR